MLGIPTANVRMREGHCYCLSPEVGPGGRWRTEVASEPEQREAVGAGSPSVGPEFSSLEVISPMSLSTARLFPINFPGEQLQQPTLTRSALHICCIFIVLCPRLSAGSSSQSRAAMLGSLLVSPSQINAVNSDASS